MGVARGRKEDVGMKWLDDAVFYEIYPQSFQDTNADGIGDIQGIIRRLDYIGQLGCNAIWLNPCFESPFYDAGYDVSDYCRVAPRYGTNEDLRQLFEEVHKRGMHILLDLVPGHTSAEHPWFKESMKAQPNEYSGRYIWTDSVWEGFENVQNVSGCIRGFSERDGCCATNFFSAQPALNYGFAKVTKPWQKSPESEEAEASRLAMQDVMAFWLGMGCDGFRVDMAGFMVKQDEDGSATVAFWQKVRAFLDEEFPEAVLISEWGEPGKALKAGFHMDFLLHFGPSHYMDLFRNNPYFSRKGTGDISEFVKKYKESYRSADEKGLICIPSGNHDMVRMRKYLDEEEMKIAFAFLLTMPGAPFIYYGDEIGMNYIEGIPSVEGGYERTGSRSPMQWDSTLNCGFSSAPAKDLYIRQDPSEDRPTVQARQEDYSSLYYIIRNLIALRKAHPALQSRGKIEFLYAEKNKYPLIYKRTAGEEEITIILNPYEKYVTCEKAVIPTDEILYIFGKAAYEEDGMLVAPSCSVTIFKNN